MEKLNQVMLYVDDVEKAKAFWTETLEFIEKYSPEVNLGTPSLMFKEKNFDALYSKLNDLGLTGHDIAEMNGRRVFNFQDGQGNYFAVSD
ncbi:VOC family protein [Staphylococcus aureus]|nr:VOC family protein [Staphylococcus aureus]